MSFVDTAANILNCLIQYLEIIQSPIPILSYTYLYQSSQLMIFLKEDEKKQIQARIKDMNPIFKNHKFIIFMFQALGTAILSYGISVSQYTHPIKRQHANIYLTFLVSCFLYLGIAVAAPFTGGHLNPSVTIGVTTAGLSKPKQMAFYIISQVVGALIGVLLYFIPFYPPISPPQIYSEQVGSEQIILDAVSEFFGTFIFLFGIIYACKRSYANGQYFKYLFIVMMLLLGRTKGCLNPAVGIAFQIFAAFRVGDPVVFFQIWGICLGSILGGVVAAWFFNGFYEPLLDQIQNKSQQAQQQTQ